MINLLAIDDQMVNLELIKATFSDEGNVNIFCADNARLGIELVDKHEIDVILLDICMPNIDGIETLKIIRSKYKALPILMVTANHERKNEALELGASDFIFKPYDIDELRLRTLNYAKLKQYADQINTQKKYLEEDIINRTYELDSALKLAKAAEKEIARRLGRAAEYRDIETGSHIRRMSQYSALLAKLNGMSEDEVELILYASPLHDVGKVGIPDSILLKPGRLEYNEFEIMKTHSIIGAKILENSEDFNTINAGKIIALEHHEKFDGSGYPSGKSGKDIHIYARIVAIADVFDALNSQRVYKDSMDLDKVLKIMKEGRATHFDPDLLDIFLENLDQFMIIYHKFPDYN